MEQDYAYFQLKVKQLTGIDLKLYKSQQMQRRLGSMLQRLGCKSYIEYYKLLERDPAALQRFRDFITINVSEFFRNADKFAELETRYVPALLKERRNLRVWSAGCSNGSEPYSIAIILEELSPFSTHYILGTDIDTTILEKARAGIYSSMDLKNVSKARLGKYFVKSSEADFYELKPRIRSKVDFQTHNLLRDPFPADMDLIVCRNVVIYFTDEAKDQLYRGFFKSLRPGGYLFVGGTESILNSRQIGYQAVSPFYYQKPLDAVGT